MISSIINKKFLQNKKTLKNLIVTTNFSTNFRMLDIEDDTEIWPKSAVNTLINVCPQGEHRIIERLGKFHSVQSGGWFVASNFFFSSFTQKHIKYPPPIPHPSHFNAIPSCVN